MTIDSATVTVDWQAAVWELCGEILFPDNTVAAIGSIVITIIVCVIVIIIMFIIIAIISDFRSILDVMPSWPLTVDGFAIMTFVVTLWWKRTWEWEEVLPVEVMVVVEMVEEEEEADKKVDEEVDEEVDKEADN